MCRDLPLTKKQRKASLITNSVVLIVFIIGFIILKNCETRVENGAKTTIVKK